jgi:hypothetical protein
MTPPSAPKEDASWLQLKEYEVKPVSVTAYLSDRNKD